MNDCPNITWLFLLISQLPAKPSPTRWECSQTLFAQQQRLPNAKEKWRQKIPLSWSWSLTPSSMPQLQIWTRHPCLVCIQHSQITATRCWYKEWLNGNDWNGEGIDPKWLLLECCQTTDGKHPSLFRIVALYTPAGWLMLEGAKSWIQSEECNCYKIEQSQ